MKERLVKISSIIENQLPEFVRIEFPLAEEFISQYYKYVESFGLSFDLISNIDQYIKIDYILSFKEFAILNSKISFGDSTINVESTVGFPEKYGLIKIGEEIITYTSKTNNSFEGCIRGFSGIESFNNPEEYDLLVFSDSQVEEHDEGSRVENLSILLLKEFLRKIKKQITPGFENRDLYKDLDERLFIKQAGDFYKTKGTESSFKILFYALYGKNVDVIRPRDYLIQPSDAQYRITQDIVAELVFGNPLEIVNGTLYQDEDEYFPGARGTVTNIEEIIRENKIYYKIGLDYDYNKDIDVTGTLKGKFEINPKTIIISDVSIGSNFIDVDSTIGFPESGDLVVNLDNGSELIIRYKSKTINQFFDCSGILQNIPRESEIKLNKFVYGLSKKNRSQQVRFRITGVISGLKFIGEPYLYENNDTIRITTLGSNLDDFKSNNWFFNIPTNYDIKNIELLDSSDFSYRVTLFDTHRFSIGNGFTLESSTGRFFDGVVVFVENDHAIIIKGQRILDTSLKYIIRKNISKVNFTNYPDLNFYNSNVQNVYSDLDKSIYVASQSFPSYLNSPLQVSDDTVEFYGSVNGFDLSLKDINGTPINHPFYTGDAVVFKTGNPNSPITQNGVYYVKKINDNIIRLSRSRDNIFNNQFIQLNGLSVKDRLEFFEFNNRNLELKTLKPQGLIKQLTDPSNSGNDYITEPGPVGIFINGVELINYKSKDLLFFGPIEEIIPLSGGSGYNVINPPTLNIFDENGSGCIPHCGIEGSLNKIDIIDQGFDYLETPKVIIRGGSGTGASASANLVLFDHIEKFNSLSGISTNENSITFLDYHKFRDSEEVIYISDGNVPVGGIIPNSSYFAKVQDEYTIKLHKSFVDSVVGINTINITSNSAGTHFFKAKNKKKKIGSIKVLNSGFGYKNRKTSVSISGINTALNIFTIKDHGYETGEIIKYYPTNIPISGLSSSSPYIVTKLNSDQFKLSKIGTDDIQKNFFFDDKQYVNIISSGDGNHYFNYEPIEVKIEGRIGISSVGSKDFNAIVNPSFLGEIKSIFIENGGVNYGNNEILNYSTQPEFLINSGSGCILIPVISDNKIVDVIIQSSGNNYNSIPDLVVNGSGIGCDLTPIIVNGLIVDVKVISTGFGYNQDNTTIDVLPYGSGSKFKSITKSWRINLVEKKISSNKISNDDGFIHSPSDEILGLQYSHLYSPRQLRSSVLSKRFDSDTFYYNTDLQLINGIEAISNSHSPIIGWAYDGNPIYGPYGFSFPSGGSIKLLTSGYKLKSTEKLLLENRPSDFSTYPIGFFIEDYEYTADGDLDEYNGRFCVTPEYLNGVYAYFTTINPISVETSGAFRNYRKPIYPYAIGNKFKSDPIENNFDININQFKFDLNSTNWVRNTTPYNLLEKNSGYKYFLTSKEERNQTTEITSTSSGSIENVKILNSGQNYRIEDTIIFSNEDGGVGFRPIITSIKGPKVKKISVEQIEVDDVELITYNSFIGAKTLSSILKDGDRVRITTPFEFNRETLVKLKKLVNLSLSRNVDSVESTGIITDFSVSGTIDSELFENDLLEIDDEVVQILNIDMSRNIIRVKRNIDNSLNTIHQSGSIVREKFNKFIINLGISTSYNLKRDKQFYFESNKVVGIGSTYGVGITTEVLTEVENFRSRVSIGTGFNTRLFFNNLKEKGRYSFNDIVNIVDSLDVNFNLPKSKVVGIGNTFIEIDFDSSNISNSSLVTGFLNKLKKIKIPTRSIKIDNHGLQLNDKIVYIPPENGDPIVVADPKSPEEENPLPEKLNLYVVPINEDFIGLSTEPITSNITNSFSMDMCNNSLSSYHTESDNLLMFYDSGSNDLYSGDTHSIKVIYDNKLESKIIKNLVTIETEFPHNLLLKDLVNVRCISGITTTLKVKYNDYNRRTTIGEHEFLETDINLETNTIRIDDHKFKTGEKVIHESSSPCDGLIDQKIYYIFVVDQNNIRLTPTLSETKKVFPVFVTINSKSFGKFSKINPNIKITKFSILKFDLSDKSLSFVQNSNFFPAFKLELYTDSNFKHKFITTKKTKIFEVRTSGIVGVSSDASLEINFNDNVPEILYYKLVPINLRNNSIEKIESVVDIDQISNNQINVVQSGYDGIYDIIDIDDFSFKYTVLDLPEKVFYDDTIADISYTTTSPNAVGPIGSIAVTSGGKYKKLPYFIGIDSEEGRNCLLEAETKTIGKINSYEIDDIGFNYSVDKTIRPKLKLPEILKVEPLSIIDNIEVLFLGEKYSNSPDLIVFDGVTNEIVSDLLLEYNIKEREVNIIANTNGINNVSPIIIPVNNSTGFGISSIFYNENSKDVVLTVDKEFSDLKDFPFEIGSRILIENVSVSSTERGYNSEDYNYKLFVINDIDANIGGIGATISYSLLNDINDDETPGVYDNSIISGIIVPESYFPKFKVNLKKKDFSDQETILSTDSIGFVENWDKNNELLKVSTNLGFNVRDLIAGQSSGTKATINNIKSFDAYYEIDSASIVRRGWKKETGFTNNNTQRTHDSDYYQYFSYSLKSQISFDKWQEPVESLNHPAGLKKFSDLNIESTPVVSGINTDQNLGDFSGICDFYSEIDLNCVYDFDLVRENNISFTNRLKSNEIYFESKILQDYIESFGNRVLLIDDISSEFNSNPRPTPFSIVDEFSIENNRFKKYFLHIIDRRFIDESQFIISSLLQDDLNYYMNQYSKIVSKNFLGDFDFIVTGNTGNLLFFPINFEINNYTINFLSFDLSNKISSYSDLTLGDIVNITGNSEIILPNTISSSIVCSISSTYRSSKIISLLSFEDKSYYEVNEITLIHDGTNVYSTEYGQLTSSNVSPSSGCGNYNFYLDNNSLVVDFTPNSEYTSSIICNNFIISLSDSSFTEVGSTFLDQDYLKSSSVSIESSFSTNQNKIISYTKDYTSAYYIISIEDITNSNYKVTELVVLYNKFNDKVYYTEFGSVATNNNIGILSAEVEENNISIYFTTLENIDCEVRIFEMTLGIAQQFETIDLTLSEE
jgi:hypothetical protein